MKKLVLVGFLLIATQLLADKKEAPSIKETIEFLNKVHNWGYDNQYSSGIGRPKITLLQECKMKYEVFEDLKINFDSLSDEYSCDISGYKETYILDLTRDTIKLSDNGVIVIVTDSSYALIDHTYESFSKEFYFYYDDASIIERQDTKAECEYYREAVRDEDLALINRNLDKLTDNRWYSVYKNKVSSWYRVKESPHYKGSYQKKVKKALNHLMKICREKYGTMKIESDDEPF